MTKSMIKQYIKCCVLFVFTFVEILATSNGFIYGEEGKKVTIECDVNDTVTSNILWQMQSVDTYINISRCFINKTCENYNSSFSSKMIDNASQLTLTLSRSALTWRCMYDEIHAQSITIHVYVLAYKPSCYELQIINNNKTISIKCRTDRVYPAAKCLLHQDPNDTLVLSKETYSHNTSLINVNDVSTECTLEYNFLSVNRTMKLSLTVGMYTIANDTEVTSDLLNFDLSSPQSELATDCPLDYIMLGAPATCTCKLTNPGSPPGQVYWYSTNGGSLVTSDQFGGQLKILYNPFVPSPVYICTTRSAVFNNVFTKKYEPKLAYGPNSVSMDIKLSRDYYATVSDRVVIRCHLPISQVNPEVTFSFNVASIGHFVTNDTSTNGTSYYSIFTFTTNTQGLYTVTCHAMNSKFPSLSAETFIEVPVYGGTAKVVFDPLTTDTADACAVIPVTCKTVNSAIYPGTNTSLVINGDEVTKKSSTTGDAIYTLTYNFLPPTSGKFNMECIVVNSGNNVELSRINTMVTVSSGNSCGASNTIAIIIGACIGGGVLLIAILVIILVVCLRRRKNNAQRQQQSILKVNPNSSITVIVQTNENGEPLVELGRPPPYSRSDSGYSGLSYGYSQWTDSTGLSDNHRSQDSEESIYHTLDNEYLDISGVAPYHRNTV